jgi:hypothetical protein
VSSLATGTAKRRVYNLEVIGTPEYFANGVLVHNCSFPAVKHEDQVDASAYAFNCLALAGGSESSPATGEDRADFLVGGL